MRTQTKVLFFAVNMSEIFSCFLMQYYLFVLLTLSNYCSGHILKETNVCDGIKVGDEVTFEVTLEATHCVKQRDFALKIGPSGLDETLAVDVHVQCDCDCQLHVNFFSPTIK